MKKILAIFCLFMAVYVIYFPLSYFGTNADKKEVKVSHILLDTREKAVEIKQKIENGAEFGTLAKSYSSCPSKENNGELGIMQRNRLEKNIDELIFKMPLNQISEPIKTDYGWHVLKVTQINYYSDINNFKYNKYKYLDL